MKTKINEDLILEIRPENEDEERMLELWFNANDENHVSDVIHIHFRVEDGE